jgi:phage shock protein A
VLDLFRTRIDDAVDRYAEMERRVDKMEANTEAFDLGKDRLLAEDFADLEAENSILEELERKKEKLKQKQK